MPDGEAPKDPVRMTVPEMADVVHSLSPQTASMSITEVTGLVQLFNNQLLAMEGRLTQKMDDNSARATERWVKHDAEQESNTKRVVARFEKLEGAILTVEKTLEAHLDREHEEDLINEARVKPIKGVAAWLWKNWRDVLLLFIGIVAAGTFFLDWLTHLGDLAP